MIRKNTKCIVRLIFIITILVMTIFPILPNNEISGDLSNPSSLKNHSPIYIYSDSQFTSDNGVVRGNGTKYNPYIIENWSIDATNNNGIQIDHTNSYFKIRNCHIFNGTNGSSDGDGIRLYYVNNGILENNKIVSNDYGITLSFSDSNTIINCSCDSNNNGIYLRYSDYNTLSNCTFNSNNQQGIKMMDSHINNIITCTCSSNNDEGIYIRYSHQNRIYNNFFNNKKNYYAYNNIRNIWNTSKTIGKNIIDGPYLGGNYWSDYTGIDTDGDGLGDTNRPYGPGDNRPLFDIIPPNIIDKTTEVPTTGDLFTFNATARDNIFIQEVYLYWYLFNTSKYSNITMNKISGNNRTRNYSQNILVSSKATKLHYNISVVDKYGNWNSTSIITLIVIDNDKPIIKDFTSSLPTTGDNFTFNVSARDNINISRVQMEYWYDYSSHYNTILTLNGSFYYKDIVIPLDVKTLCYKISTMDNASNWAFLEIKILNVTDNDEPIIIDLSGTPSTGDNYTFEFCIDDNLGILSAYLNYWVDDGIQNNITLIEKQTYRFIVPKDGFILYAIVVVVDTSNNTKTLNITKSIIDNDVPIIKDITPEVPETGREFVINCTVSENRMIKNVSIDYWFDDNQPILDSMNFEDWWYLLKINIPSDAGKFYYIITAVDTNNNSVNLQKTLMVNDVIPPNLIDLTNGEPTTGDNFVINVSAKDNIGIKSIWLEYDFDGNKEVNITFNNSHLINIPSNAKVMHYKISAYDLSGNLQIINKSANVIDNDPPIIICHETRNPTTGEYYGFNTEISDNIIITISYLEYWFDDGKHVKINHPTRYYSILVPKTAILLHFICYAEDGNNNTIIITQNLDVIDNDNPHITDYSIKSETTYRFIAGVKDNMEVSEVRVEYWFDSGIGKNIPLQLTDGKYEGTISIPKEAKKLIYSFSALDSSGNIEITDEMEIVLKGIESNQTQTDFEPSSPSKTSKNGESGITLIITLIIIIILIITIVLIGGFYFYLRKKRDKKELKHKETGTTKSQTKTTSIPKLAYQIPISQSTDYQQLPQAIPLAQLSPTQTRTSKFETIKTIPQNASENKRILN